MSLKLARAVITLYKFFSISLVLGIEFHPNTKLNRDCYRKTRGGIAMKNQLRWDFPRVLVVVLVIVGIVTAALNVTFGGFTPIMWFLLALVVLLIITCHEVMRIRISLESKNP
jgi:uncharacterized protein (DUF983 family)